MRIVGVLCLGLVCGCGLDTAGLGGRDAGAELVDGGAGDASVTLDAALGLDASVTCTPVAETCNGNDDDCNGMIDDGFMCRQSLATRCMTACSTPGMALCNTTCDGIFGPCLGSVEVCGNACDDDGVGGPDDGCGMAPANDRCPGAQILAAAGVTSGISLAGATIDIAGCGDVDLFYAVDLAQESIVYLDTFGSELATAIKYVGTDCSAMLPMPVCVTATCGGAQSQAAMLLAAGRHYFAIGAADASRGALTITHRVVPAAGGEDVVLSRTGHTDGATTGQPDSIRHSCLEAGGGVPVGSPEDGFWWMQCPGTTRRVVAETCEAATNYDTVLYVVGPGLEVCNDDGPGACMTDSQVDFMATGKGVFQIFVDGWNGDSGSYRFNASMF